MVAQLVALAVFLHLAQRLALPLAAQREHTMIDLHLHASLALEEQAPLQIP